MNQHRALHLAVLVVLVLVGTMPVTPHVYGQGGTVVVSPANLQGWLITPYPTPDAVPYAFVSGTAAIGSGSLQMGPISGAATNKLILRPPYFNQPVADFTSFSYGYYIDPASSASGNDSDHLYTNVYVDSAANGVGTYASWYDCRYDFLPPVIGAGTWGTATFDRNYTGWGRIVGPGGLCPASLGALPAGSLIMFISMNAGDTAAHDNGLLAYFDRVVITGSAGATIYDFEQAGKGASGNPNSGPFGYTDGRINYLDIAAPVAVYAWDWGTYPDGTPRRGLILYAINEYSRGYEVLQVPPDVIEAVPETPEHNTRLAQATRDGLRIEVWRLSSGEFHVHVWQPNGKEYILIFSTITPQRQPYTSFETP